MEVNNMKKKICLVIAIIFGITLLTQIQPFIDGIIQRGWDGTNYGRVIFPLLFMIIAIIMYRRE